MPCKKCDKEPVIKLISGKNLCRGCFIKYFEKKILKTIKKYELINKKDKLLVAASGGKDSTTLLYVLNKLFSDPERIEVITVDPLIGKFSELNVKRLEKFCKKYKLKLHKISFRDAYGKSLCYLTGVLKEKGFPMKSCSVCGVLRRKIINKFARENKFDLVLTGHNLDDEAQAFLMNTFTNKMEVTSRLGPKTGIIKDKKFVQRVKPLYFCTEEEISVYSKLMKFDVIYGHCPCRTNALRAEVADLLNKFEKNHPGTKNAIVNSFLSIMPELKNKYKSNKPINICKHCGEPTSQEECKVCEILKKLK